MVGNNKSSKMKTKNKSIPPLTPKSTPSTPTTIESETPVTTPYASTTSSSKPRVEDLLEMISIQDSKIDKLTKRVTNLDQCYTKHSLATWLQQTRVNCWNGVISIKTIFAQVVPCDIRCRTTSEKLERKWWGNWGKSS